MLTVDWYPVDPIEQLRQLGHYALYNKCTLLFRCTSRHLVNTSLLKSTNLSHAFGIFFLQTCPVLMTALKSIFHMLKPSYSQILFQEQNQLEQNLINAQNTSLYISTRLDLGSSSLVSQFTRREIFIEPKIEIIP